MMTSSFTALLCALLSMRLFDDVTCAHAVRTSASVVVDSQIDGVVADEVHIEYHPGPGSLAVGSFGSEWGGDWSVLTGVVGGRLNQARCVDIPTNMTLCRNIGYHQMRLPNLLEHDSISEATQQATSWVPLLNIRCHTDTQMFLCSLFAPVCLDRPIFPCRSLCTAVQQGCQGRMNKYGFPWPDMLHCDKFPDDNDLCIGLQTTGPDVTTQCSACNQPDTFEGIIDTFCSTNFTVRVKPSQIVVSGRDIKLISTHKKKFYKSVGLTRKLVHSRLSEFYIENGASCQCNVLNTDRTVSTLSGELLAAANESLSYLLVSGHVTNNRLIVTSLQSLARPTPHTTRALSAIKQKSVCTTAAAGIAALPASPVNAPFSTTTMAAVTNTAAGNTKKDSKRKDERKLKVDKRKPKGVERGSRERGGRIGKGGEGRGRGGAERKVGRKSRQPAVELVDGAENGARRTRPVGVARTRA